MARVVSFIGGLLVVIVPSFVVGFDQPPLGTVAKSILESVPEFSIPEIQLVNVEEFPSDWSVDSVIESTQSKITELTSEIKKLEEIELTKSGFLSLGGTKSETVVLTPAYVKAQVQEIARAFGIDVQNTEYDESMGWLVELENGEQVILGLRDIDQRLIRAFAMVASLPGSETNFDRTLDARYVRGVAVSNTPKSELAAQ